MIVVWSRPTARVALKSFSLRRRDERFWRSGACLALVVRYTQPSEN
jgi:hypothetical protein